MATEETTEETTDQAAVGLAKHITAWRESHGDATVDAALELAEGRRTGVRSKAEAAQARAASGQSRESAPAGRSSAAKSEG